VALNQPYCCQHSTLENFQREKKYKEKLKNKNKKQTQQQQHTHTHTHTHKPNKTTVFLVLPNQMVDGMEPIKHRFKRLFI
jgi:hypothetical protein